MPAPLRTPIRHRLASAAVTTAALVVLSASAMPVMAQDTASTSPAPPPQASTVPSSPAPMAGAVTLYTSVTQDTIDAVLAAFAEQHPEVPVEVFRAPTGELDARIASELRSGGLGADVLWVSDPLSLQRYEADGLLAPLAGPAVEAVPAEYRTPTSVGTRLLNLVIVAGQEVEPCPPTGRTSPIPRTPVPWPSRIRASPARPSRPSATSPGRMTSASSSISGSGTTARSRWPRRWTS